jgi:CIC family chloride channel protein
LGGCTAAYLISCLLMKNSIMTEKIARRGSRVPNEYTADVFESMLVREAMSKAVVTLSASDRPAEALAQLTSRGSAMAHQGFPVMDGERVVGVVTRWDLLEGTTANVATVRDLVKRPVVVVSDGSSLREAADQLVRAGVGRLPVVSQADPSKLVGILTRSDLLSAHERRLDAAVPQVSRLPIMRRREA